MKALCLAYAWCILVLACLQPWSAAAQSVCLKTGLTEITWSGGASSANSTEWPSDTSISGASTSAVWNLTNSIVLDAGVHARLSCLQLSGVVLASPSSASFGQPAALQFLPAASGQHLTLQDVTILTDCGTVHQYQRYLCNLNMTLLAGVFEVSSAHWLYMRSWQSVGVTLSGVNISCTPPPAAVAAGAVLRQPACLATAVGDATAMLAAVDRLQRVQGPAGQQPLPVVVIVVNTITLTMGNVSPYWPLGIEVTGNVSIAAALVDNAVLDWGGLVNVINLHPAPGYLTLSGFIMINLPRSYAGPVSSFFHTFGILPTTLLSINRVAPPVLAIVSCVYVCPWDVFSFWAYWLSLASSPTPQIAQLSSWTKFQRQQGTGTDPDRLHLTDTPSTAVLWRNLTLANPNIHPLTNSYLGLLDITNVNGLQSYIPPTALFQVMSVADMMYAVNLTIGDSWTRQFGQILLMVANISGDISSSMVNSTRYPQTRHAGAAASGTPPPAGPAGSYELSAAAALLSGASLPQAPPPPPGPPTLKYNLPMLTALQVPTTVTTWPNDSVCWDVAQTQGRITITAAAQLTVRTLSLMNLPPASGANLSGADPTLLLVSGMWIFRQEGSISSKTNFLTLVNVTIMVPVAELSLYRSAASLQPLLPRQPQEIRVTASGATIMAAWIVQQEVTASGRTWIFYDILVTSEFFGTGINITSDVPQACSDFEAIPVYISYGPYTADPASRSAAASGLPAWAIGVIVGLSGGLLLAAGLAALLVLRHRRSRSIFIGKESSSLGAPPGAAGLLGLSRHSNERDSSAALMLLVEQSPDQTNKSTSQVQLVGLSAVSGSFSQLFSEHCSRNMIDASPARAAATPLYAHTFPEALINKLATKNNGLKDAQLQIFGVLGRGGHGIVYQGLWKGLPVAAKVMIVHEEQHEAAQRQMLEAMISTSLSHPNIVTTYTYDLKRLSTASPSGSRAQHSQSGVQDSGPLGISQGTRAVLEFTGATAWQLLILQELCTGGTLRQMIDGKQDAAPEAYVPNMEHAVQLALDVASGLEHLHSKNVVHSDMTPNNVLLQAASAPRGAGLCWTAKVADFGLSVAFEEGKSHMSKVFAGTPFYIAPETQNDGIISLASDVFALGILMYELVHGPVKRPNNGMQLPPPSPPLGLSDNCPPPGNSTAPFQPTAASGPSSAELPPQAAEAALASSSPLPVSPLPLLMGGCGGKFGPAHILPRLPPSCPPLYVSLVVDCLSPVPQSRPTMAAVCRRLQTLVQVLVVDGGLQL